MLHGVAFFSYSNSKIVNYETIQIILRSGSLNFFPNTCCDLKQNYDQLAIVDEII